MSLFEQIKKELKKLGCDYLYVNHTNRFFSEYVDVGKSSRFLLTKFSGSCGDAIVSKDKIYLFVDSRYWEQAEKEVDTNIVEVVKIGIDYTFETAVKSLLKPKSKIAFYKEKTSFYLYEQFENWGFDIKLVDVDFVEQYFNLKQDKLDEKFIKIKNSIVGKSTKYKIAKIQKKLKDNEVAIISSLEDVSYLMNMKSSNFEYSSIIYGKIIIKKDGYKFYKDEKGFAADIKQIVKNDKNTSFLIDKANLSIQYKKYFKNYTQPKFLTTLRTIKYKSEIEHMQSCFERTDMVLTDVFKTFQKQDFREDELFNFVNEKFIEYGAETNSFTTILASGENSSVVHFSHPTNRQINKGEFVLLDCGGIYEGGYATDITRTFMKGEPKSLHKKVYTTVLRAFLNAYNADLAIYNTGYKIDKIARDIIREARLDGFVFGHGLGHSVGRSVHDGLPTISPSKLAKLKIKENMVFTVEPGLYKQNWGGVRLENTTHVIKENGKLRLKSFSKAPFQKKLIDYSMLSAKEKEYLKEWSLI